MPVNVTGFVEIPEGDEDALTHAIANVGPISVYLSDLIPEF